MKPLRLLILVFAGAAALRTATKARGRKVAVAKTFSENGHGPSLTHTPRTISSTERFEGMLVKPFSLINKYRPWYRLPLPVALLNLIALRHQLREHNLYDTSTPHQINVTPVEEMTPQVLYTRTAEGSYNDLSAPAMGSTGVRFGRNVPLEYTFPEKEPELLTPSPREVSSKLMTRDSFVPATTLNMLAAAWIQFMTHDWFNHGKSVPDDNFALDLAAGDPWFERPMHIPRTTPDPTRSPLEKDLPPTYTNAVSHWWDASGVYGCDDQSCAKLRCWTDGKLTTEEGRLPLDPATGLTITGFNDNWWIGLGLMHTLFALEHNSICDRIKAEYPLWDDERLYQTARLINAALMAKIHTVEWTTAILANPALQISMNANWWGLATERIHRMMGRISDSEVVSGIPGSPVEHHGVPFTLTEEFAAVYRLHPLIPDDIEIRSLATGGVLKELTFPEVANRNAATVIDENVSVEDVFYSFGTSHPGAVVLHNYPRFLQDLVTQNGVRVDLAAVDIIRDRERGVPRYNQFRRLMHMQPARTFEELTTNAEWAQELREVYGDVERVDLMTGMYAEPPPPGFGFSDTAFRVFILMASRRIKSDRFFTDDFTPQVYTKAGIEWIGDNNMSSILIRHYPELAAPLRKVDNAFAPWTKMPGRD